jgi:broad specificity phosphatase PhoE
MKFVFVRHGESEANIADFINDDPHRQVALTALGRRQAESVAQDLKEFGFVRAFASEFLRAQQTAEVILAHHGCRLELDARLNERRSGMDGLPTAAFNDLVRPDPVNIRPPHGESFVEQMERLAAFLDEMAGTAEGTVLCVSHENPINAVRALAGLAPDKAAREKILNCGWIEVTWPPTQTGEP